MDDEDEHPILTCVSSSARQLYLLLRCINFSEKAHVQLSEEGIKFSVDEASAMEGSAFLDKSLFTAYTFRTPPPQRNSQNSDDEDEEDTSSTPTFQISLPSLLETLQIFGLTDPNTSKPPWARENPTSTAFSNTVLGMNNMCRISYDTTGAPLSIILTEATIRTTCNLTTYEPAFADEIPFDRQSIAFKTIMRGSWLFDAISELSSTSPEKLTMVARMHRGKPYFALSSSGDLGSARVEFNNNPYPSNRPPPPPTNPNPTDAENGPQPTPHLLEIFKLSSPSSTLRNSYKFSLIQKAARAMSVATKVSVRADTQGVLSLQFMIEVESGKICFVDFRFVPLVDEDGDDDEGEGEETMMGDGNGDEGPSARARDGSLGSGTASEDEDDDDDVEMLT
ncbi:repair protein Rad1/Rec1/Rad17-domain-containing protein [Massariosphaeria phaeospora]|uniref:Repair protein Rad1/Rec1/Rad17-domain-containing protein n=1 Tax=Massariosphaeria phaeospora TaxID=100035 RepID=A0A7C8M4V1_9PLEO|nr:repair protein Rad1/Rec1/Rad17-domain-containing protein [Massariosphaeria phaeospora]